MYSLFYSLFYNNDEKETDTLHFILSQLMIVNNCFKCILKKRHIFAPFIEHVYMNERTIAG